MAIEMKSATNKSDSLFQFNQRFLDATRQAKNEALEQLLINCQLVNATAMLVHQLQRERGLSCIYLGNRDPLLKQELLQQHQRSTSYSDILQQLLEHTILDKKGNHSELRLICCISNAFQKLQLVVKQRREVLQCNDTAEITLDRYADTILALFVIILEAADLTLDHQINRHLMALSSLMFGKEFVGQERARGASFFSHRCNNELLSEQLSTLKQKQQQHFSLFQQLASTEVKSIWHANVSSHELQRQVTQLRLIITSAASANESEDLSDVWFTVWTSWIDQVQQVEQIMCSQLFCLAEAQIARQGRKNETTVSLMHPFGSMDWFTEQTSFESCPSRTVLDFLQFHAENAEELSKIVNEKEKQLQEQNIIKQAKLLLIKHYRLSDEQAYKQLRSAAMKNNTSIIQIAEMILKKYHKGQ